MASSLASRYEPSGLDRPVGMARVGTPWHTADCTQFRRWRSPSRWAVFLSRLPIVAASPSLIQIAVHLKRTPSSIDVRDRFSGILTESAAQLWPDADGSILTVGL